MHNSAVEHWEHLFLIVATSFPYRHARVLLSIESNCIVGSVSCDYLLSNVAMCYYSQYVRSEFCLIAHHWPLVAHAQYLLIVVHVVDLGLFDVLHP